MSTCAAGEDSEVKFFCFFRLAGLDTFAVCAVIGWAAESASVWLCLCLEEALGLLEMI